MEEKMVGVGNDDWERGAQEVPCPFHQEDYDYFSFYKQLEQLIRPLRAH